MSKYSSQVHYETTKLRVKIKGCVQPVYNTYVYRMPIARFFPSEGNDLELEGAHQRRSSSFAIPRKLQGQKPSATSSAYLQKKRRNHRRSLSKTTQTKPRPSDTKAPFS